ncbi:MAG TPA: nucleotidyltransferase domain-containing protein [Vicinamibacteria bacterium]
MTPDLAVGRLFLEARGAPGAFLVGVTGAHYYGFPSPDSDLDLKGVHVAPTRDVVSLKPPPDSFDHLGLFEGVEIDYTSHELGTALRLLLKGNGNILERILSPWQLLDSAAAGELRALAGRTVSQKFLHHYRGFLGRACRDFRAAQPPTVKGLLYAYRSGLTGIHLLRTGECVGDVRVLAPVYGFDRVPELVARKAGSREHGVLADAAGFEADLERLERTLQDAAARSPLPLEATSADELNEFLIRMRKERFA